MKERSLTEAITDRVLLLYLLVKMREKGYNVSGDVKLQKLLYKIEERMNRNKFKGLSYNFVRWHFGPFSQEVYVDTADLEKTGFLRTFPDKSMDISADGIKLINALRKYFEQNRRFAEFFDRTINEFGPYKGDEIRVAIYTYPKGKEKKTIAKTRKGEVLLEKLGYEEATDRFWIDDEWSETLRVLFDPLMYGSIKKGLKALREEKGRPFVPVTE